MTKEQLGLVTRFLRRITDAGWVDALGACEPGTAPVRVMIHR